MAQDNPRHNKPPAGTNKSHQPDVSEKEQTIAQNPNPRANENIRNTPFDKEKNYTPQTGSEITDGEDG